MDFDKILVIAIQAGSFISAFAALAAGVIMSQVTKKFGAGIMASGYRSISIGVFFIAIGIIIDAVNSYLQISGNVMIVLLILLRQVFFVIGTYIIVIGSKKTGDKLESLTK